MGFYKFVGIYLQCLYVLYRVQMVFSLCWIFGYRHANIYSMSLRIVGAI